MFRADRSTDGLHRILIGEALIEEFHRRDQVFGSRTRLGKPRELSHATGPPGKTGLLEACFQSRSDRGSVGRQGKGGVQRLSTHEESLEAASRPASRCRASCSLNIHTTR